MNLDMIKRRLAELNSQPQKSSNSSGESIFWKPSPGTNLIRILPNPYNKDYPFSEFFFYYDLGERTIISPKSFGRPDPIVEFAQTLRRSKSGSAKDDFKLALKLEPKARTYVTVLVRGREEEGPKLWGFGKTVFGELLALMADPDYGDITDMASGRDIVVDYSPSDDPLQSKTKIRAKPNISRAFESPAVMEKIKAMQNPETIWSEPTYAELEDLLKNFLTGMPTSGPAASTAATETSDSFATTKAQTKEEVDTAISDLEEMINDLPF